MVSERVYWGLNEATNITGGAEKSRWSSSSNIPMVAASNVTLNDQYGGFLK